MRLNKKGYITIEVIVGAALTAVIAFFLIELTMKLVNKTDDYYADTLVTTDKALIIKNVKQAIENDIGSYGIIKTISCSESICTINYDSGTSKVLKLTNRTIDYGDGSYKKEFSAGIDNLELKGLKKANSSYVRFRIIGNNIFNGEEYNFNILILNKIKNNTLISHLSNLYMPGTTIRNNSVNYDLDTGHQLMKDSKNNLRYYGASPNNYIYFNCDTYPDTNCETWRIIGIVDGKVKLVRNTIIGTYSWDTSESSVNSGWGINQWGPSTYVADGRAYKGADGMKLLNPGYESNQDLDNNGNNITVNNSLYYNSGSGTCYGGDNNDAKDCDFTSVGEQGIKNTATKNKIADATFYLGGGNDAQIYPNTVLEIERGTNIIANPSDGVERKTTWVGKIAIPYPSDYGYAADLSLCVDKKLEEYNDTTCKSNNWMRKIMTNNGNNSCRLLTPNSEGAPYGWLVMYTGAVKRQYYVKNANGLVPTLYLKSDIVIKSGDGTIDNPYRIS